MKFIKIALSAISNNEEKQRLQKIVDQIQLTMSVDSFKLGFIGPLTGHYAPLGLEIIRGARLAVMEYNEKINLVKQKVTLVEGNSDSDPEKIPSLVENLVMTEKVLAIVGPVVTTSLTAISPHANKHRIVCFTPTTKEANIPDLSNYIFRNSITDEQQVKALVDYSIDLVGATKFGTLFPQTSAGIELKKTFEEYVLARGGQVLSSIPYLQNATDFADPLKKIKDIPIEVLFVPDYSSKVAQIAPQLAFHDITEIVLMGTNMLHSPDLIKIGGKYVENIIFTDNFFVESDSTQDKEFIERYNQEFGLKPTRYAAQSFDTANMIISLIRQGVRSRESMRENLASLKNFRGVTGVLSLDKRGETQRSIQILTVQNSEFVTKDIQPVSP